ncbi:electron transfer flavoprotein subunit beta/FixA family protein [Albidovulum sp.]|uniref:electron transfer flavoprotein subunit beta/FixA family protein n=1 Tax=Albidovulum sp. TaxID=1872424 RepID=UPI0039B9B97A
MEILVLIKKVPDANLPETLVTIAPDGGAIQLHPAAQVGVNLYDLNAVELAVTLKEAHGGTVTVMTAGDASTEQYLRRAVSMGADRAVRVDVTTDVLTDPHAVAGALAAAIRQAGNFQVILAGRQASDTDAGLVPHAVAVALDAPSLAPVVSVGDVTGTSVVAGKLSDATVDHYEMPFPAVLCVSNEINKPRVPSLKGVMASKKVAIEVIAVEAEARAAKASYAMKAGTKAAATVVVKDGSDDDKAAALLAVLGM